MKLEGKRALVTGASSGIGRAIARELGRRGVVLALAARRTPALESLAAEISAEGGTRPVVLTADLSRAGEAALCAEVARVKLGGVDLLVNNAGVNITGRQEEIGDDQAAREMFETNYWSPLALTRALVPAMREAGEGA